MLVQQILLNSGDTGIAKNIQRFWNWNSSQLLAGTFSKNPAIKMCSIRTRDLNSWGLKKYPYWKSKNITALCRKKFKYNFFFFMILKIDLQVEHIISISSHVSSCPCVSIHTFLWINKRLTTGIYLNIKINTHLPRAIWLHPRPFWSRSPEVGDKGPWKGWKRCCGSAGSV